MHAWNGTWGVIATGLLAGQGLVLQSYGSNPEYSGDFVLAGDQSNLNVAPNDYFRQWGCFLGGNGRLLACQLIYLMWLCGALPACSRSFGLHGRRCPLWPALGLELPPAARAWFLPIVSVLAKSALAFGPVSSPASPVSAVNLHPSAAYVAHLQHGS